MGSKLHRGNRTLIKALNRSLVFNTIRRQGPLSRTQLTELSGLSVGAVSQITSELLEKGWILEVGEGDYTGGRRQTLLRLNPNAGAVVGIKLMEDRVVSAVTDLETNLLYYDVRPTDPDRSPDGVSQSLARIVRDVVAISNIDRKVLGVGVGLAGAIDSLEGVVHSSPFFGWREIPLAQQIEQQLKLPVYIENDVNTLTITEQLFGPARHVGNFIVVTVGRGIGMGMVINDQLYQGVQGGAGELGHIPLEANGPLCDCGNRGCLEALAADPAVIGEVAAALTRGINSKVQRPVTLQAIVEAADAGDSLAREVLARSGRYLGIGLATVVNLICPSLIILSGEGIIAGDHRIQPMMQTLRSHVFNGFMDHVEMVIQPSNDYTWARGAASLVIGRLFESPRIDSQAFMTID